MPLAVRHFYENPWQQADAAITGAIRNGANVPEEILNLPRRPPTARGGVQRLTAPELGGGLLVLSRIGSQ